VLGTGELHVCLLCCVLIVGDATDDEQLSQWQTAADAGDERAQLSLGRHYLQLAQLGNDAQTNAKFAVSYLVRSSSQGNEDATKLLVECLDREFGWCRNGHHR